MFGKPGSSATHRRTPRARSGWRLTLIIGALIAASMPAANAYWSSSGDAAGSGETGTTTSLTMSPGTPSTLLRPGGTADVALTISNPNTEPVQLTAITLDAGQGASGFSVDAAHSSCATSALTFSPQASGWTVPARTASVDGTLAVVLVDAISMAGTAADSCQGAQFGVHLVGGS